MANNAPPAKVLTAIRLLTEGKKIKGGEREIARLSGLSRMTVRGIMERLAAGDPDLVKLAERKVRRFYVGCPVAPWRAVELRAYDARTDTWPMMTANVRPVTPASAASKTIGHAELLVCLTKARAFDVSADARATWGSNNEAHTGEETR